MFADLKIYAIGYNTLVGNIAIIGGTGFETLPPDIFAEQLTVPTRYGNATVLSVSNNYVEPDKLYFLSRHGSMHGLAPHEINYRANTCALLDLGVTHVIASNAVGSLRSDLLPGDFVVFDDFVDFTRGRELTYFTSGETWRHTDFSIPYSEIGRSAVIRAGEMLDVKLHHRATYLCSDGPRFETPAEVRLFANWGADVVGMTGLPESIYCKEVGIEYCAIGIVTNLAAGLSSEPVSHSEVVSKMAQSIDILRELMLTACAQLKAGSGL